MRCTPACIWPQPMSRQCFSTRLESATFSPSFVHTGAVSCILHRSDLTAMTRAPVHMDPMFSISTSPLDSFATLPCFSLPCVRTPSNRRSKKKFTSSSVKTCGSLPTSPSTWPTSRSARVSVGSTVVPTPMSPPGTAYCSWFCSAKSDTIRLLMGVHLIFPSASLLTIPGRTSTSWPILSTPCRIDPPATPPWISSTSAPGLLTSKERMTIILAGDVKSRLGTGIFLQMYSHTTSMLYLSCAEMGITGAPSAMVPWMNLQMASYWFAAAFSCTRSILFWRMMMCCSRMISTAARCSEVCGCGHDSFPAMSSSAPSITAAPLSIVAMRMSCPGQSTNDTCRTSFIFLSSNPGTVQSGESGEVEL
mmetsp:Transcript_13089/g.31742  ORF Transcript_13089/g.31742 Transcript_13089/m.31742 type:complete len:363 (+) Transcript_13089:311-1399(+)